MASWNTSLVLRNIQAEIDQINYEIEHSSGGIGPQGPPGPASTVPGPPGSNGATAFTMQLHGGATVYNNNLNSFGFPSGSGPSLGQYIVSDQCYQNVSTSCQYAMPANTVFLGFRNNQIPADSSNPVNDCTFHLYGDLETNTLYLYNNQTQVANTPITTNSITISMTINGGYLNCYLNNILLNGAFVQKVDETAVWFGYCSTYNASNDATNHIDNYIFSNNCIGAQGIAGPSGGSITTKCGYVQRSYVPGLLEPNTNMVLGTIGLSGAYCKIDAYLTSINLVGAITGALNNSCQLIFYFGQTPSDSYNSLLGSSYSITIPAQTSVPFPFSYSFSYGNVPLNFCSNTSTFNNIYLICYLVSTGNPSGVINLTNCTFNMILQATNPALASQLVIS